MENIPLLKDIVILMAVAVPMSIVLARAGLPTIVGFLLTGVIIGPHGFGLVTDMQTVETLAGVGVVLLLFTIGLEFSITRLLAIRREAMIGGGLQLAFTISLVWFFSTVWGHSFQVALLLGFIISMSSSAIVLKLLMDRGEVDSAHGNLSVGILLFQDLSVVVMVMVVQSFSDPAGASVAAVAKGLGVAVLAVFTIVVAAAYAIPKLFDQVVKLQNREVFILTIVLVCLGAAWIASLAGLSIAVGAFIAGLVISESEYSNQITAEVLPFRDTFSSLFFVSIGMLLEIEYFLAHMGLLIGLAAGLFAVKALILLAVGRALRYPLRLSIVVALSLAQIGEFSFILMNMGRDSALLSHDLYQSLLAVSIITMAVTPFIFQRSMGLAFRISRLLGSRAAEIGLAQKTPVSNHVIIVGYGLNGRNLARVLKETGIEHLVIDINRDRVLKAKKDGHNAYFGDASHPLILERLGINRARMIVFAITDPVGTRRAVRTVSDLNSGVSILVRARQIKEVDELYRQGAKQVISEEFETSVEIFARVLKDYRIPSNIIQNQIDLIRQEGYAMLRTPLITGDRLASLKAILTTSTMDTYYIKDGSQVAGTSLAHLDLVNSCGANILAVIRGGKATTDPPGEFTIEAGDMLVLLGSHAELNCAIKTLTEKE